jgi:hypothetical protein
MRIFPLIRRGSSRFVPIAAPTSRVSGGRCLVTARVAGCDVWFESADAQLAPSSEAFGSAMLLPALNASLPLTLAGSVCETWAANLRPLVDAFRTLWYPDAATPHAIPERRPTTPADGTALCFSGGVDAFHTLLAGGREIDTLVYVVGYDVKLRDRRRTAAVTGLVREIAAATARRSVVVTTNLRRHPLMRAVAWTRAFGGGLAAVGHLLAGDRFGGVGRMLVSSDGLGFEHPEVGSRPGTDPLFGSEALRVEHVAATTTRLEKLRRIGGEPLVQRHLRVCWHNGSHRLNCGRCEKCVRTMLALDTCGTLGKFPGFDHGRGLVAAVDALAAVDGIVSPFYRDLIAHGLTGPAAASVARLLDRSRAAATAPPPRRASASPRTPSTRHRLLGPEAFAQVCEPLVGRRVGYVRPVGNVGDDLIELAMAQLFATYGIRWSLVHLDAAPQALDGLDMLVFGGGGNMGTRYPGNHDLRGQALATGLPLVILPQSFTSAEDRTFHRVYVRERASLAYRPDGILAPDLALGLAWPEPTRPTHDLGLYLRRDQERGGRKPLLARDPIRLADTPAEYLAFAARHRRIVTDRLHFAVAGLHAGRDVTLVANDYHKNRSMHETWLADLGCRFATSAVDALALARRAA